MENAVEAPAGHLHVLVAERRYPAATAPCSAGHGVHGNVLYLSPVSAWEIAVKWAAGRLTLPEEPSVWVPSRREQNGVESMPLMEEAAVQITKLPALHKDPFDRMLICQAITEGLVLVTPDPLIRQYPVRVFW